MGKIITGAGYKYVEGGIPLSEIHELRDSTEIGETIKFRSDRYYEVALSGWIGKPKIITSKVIEKYPHVFKLENGEIYTWVDYMLGKQRLGSY